MLRLMTLLFGMTLAANVSTALAENPEKTVVGDPVYANEKIVEKMDSMGTNTRTVSMFYPKPDMSGIGATGVQSNGLPGATVTMPPKTGRAVDAAAIATCLVVDGVAKWLNPGQWKTFDDASQQPFKVSAKPFGAYSDSFGSSARPFGEPATPFGTIK